MIILYERAYLSLAKKTDSFILGTLNNHDR